MVIEDQALTNQIFSDVRLRTRILHYLFVSIYFQIKIFVRVKKNMYVSISYLHSSRKQTILAIKLIR